MDVLKAMSASPGDAQPVLDLIIRGAQQRCMAHGARMYSFAGKLMDFLTDSISDPNLDPAQIDIGAIAVDSQPGAYTEFTVTLPRATAT